MSDDRNQPSTTETEGDAESSNIAHRDEGSESIPASEGTTPEKINSQTLTTSDPTASDPAVPSSTPWQAIFSPQFNAYYFYNAETQQTTWENPLLPADLSSLPTPGQPDSSDALKDHDDNSTTDAGEYSNTAYTALQAAAAAAGIDPSLAHLDPTLLSSLPSSSTGVTAPGILPTFTAKFNARTGQFTRPDARDPTHLSEHARAARMSEFYFDVNAWEQQLAEQGGSIQGPEEGRKRKRPTKKDLVSRFIIHFVLFPLIFRDSSTCNDP